MLLPGVDLPLNSEIPGHVKPDREKHDSGRIKIGLYPREPKAPEPSSHKRKHLVKKPHEGYCNSPYGKVVMGRYLGVDSLDIKSHEPAEKKYPNRKDKRRKTGRPPRKPLFPKKKHPHPYYESPGDRPYAPPHELGIDVGIFLRRRVVESVHHKRRHDKYKVSRKHPFCRLFVEREFPGGKARDEKPRRNHRYRVSELKYVPASPKEPLEIYECLASRVLKIKRKSERQ